MEPKYSAGTRVRIRAHDYLGRVSDPKIQNYENMTGEIIESTNIVAFIAEPWARIRGTTTRISIYHYTVKINEQIILHDISEYCLEIVQ